MALCYAASLRLMRPIWVTRHAARAVSWDAVTSARQVLGAAERGGMAKASLSPRVTARLINIFLRKNIDPRSILMTDQWPDYNEVRDWMQHLSVNHSKTYVDGIIYTNTIEGFWSLVKRAITGQHHHYTSEHAPAYINKATYIVKSCGALPARLWQ